MAATALLGRGENEMRRVTSSTMALGSNCPYLFQHQRKKKKTNNRREREKGRKKRKGKEEREARKGYITKSLKNNEIQFKFPLESSEVT